MLLHGFMDLGNRIVGDSKGRVECTVLGDRMRFVGDMAVDIWPAEFGV